MIHTKIAFIDRQFSEVQIDMASVKVQLNLIPGLSVQQEGIKSSSCVCLQQIKDSSNSLSLSSPNIRNIIKIRQNSEALNHIVYKRKTRTFSLEALQRIDVD